MIEPITIDFETEAINGNPLTNPPRPVGVAIWIPGESPKYHAWGHPTGNNCTRADAGLYLSKVFETGCQLLFHNAGFDLSVWEKEWGLNFPWDSMWERIHDTMYLLFLADPYSSTLSLKPSADRYLGMPADEQAGLYNWILANVPEATPKTAGAFIARAPGDLVRDYAVGDVVRTRKLFDLLHAKIITNDMEAAYDRERRLFPIALGGTRRGIRIDRATLEKDEEEYTRHLEVCTAQLAGALQVPVEHLEKSNLLADALEKRGAVTSWTLTKTGKRSMSKDNLVVTDPTIKMYLDHIGGLKTCLQTFMRPWLIASACDGRLHPNWNQVKQYREGGAATDKKGTQTGRLSSDSPNFQNVPTEFVDSQGKPLPIPPGLRALPLMRSYCLPEEGHVWLKRDFSSQEIRILAHFEDGALCEAYRADPNLDPHEMARQLVFGITSVLYARKDIKITGFSIIYGSGVTGLSGQLGQPREVAAQIRNAYLRAMPDVRELMADVQERGKGGHTIRTWGGRLYHVEPPKVIKFMHPTAGFEVEKVQEFSYKLLNYLIQGSAADQTKESIIDWDNRRSPEAIFLATVHDEINISAPKEAWLEHMALLTECMNRERFSVPMMSEGFKGINWYDIEAVT